MPKKPRLRAVRREAARAQTKLGNALERAFALEVGGNAARPIDVASAAVVDGHAAAVACPRCSGRHEVEEHLAVTVGGARLREARLRCRQCASRRSLWFRLGALGAN